MEANYEHSLSLQEDTDVRRGPWTIEEDLNLINYVATHGEGRWNSLARSAGLKRTGKSCRLRWLNYLRPDVRRGNITLEEQLMILELHSRWGNRWSKIAQYLPGRTDNEIKNYWRTRVQKHAKQLKCDVNSKQFKDTMRYLWMPRLVERIQAASTGPTTVDPTTVCYSSDLNQPANFTHTHLNSNFTPENSANSSFDFANNSQDNGNGTVDCFDYNNQGMDYQVSMEQSAHDQQWYAGDTTENLWNVEDIYVFQPQINDIM